MVTTTRFPGGSGPRAALLRARVAAREGRQVLRSRNPVPGWDLAQGPVRVRGHDLVLRLPRVDDAAAWRQQRLACREQLEPWWPAEGDWVQAQDALAWTEQCTRLRRAARRGLAQPAVVELDGRMLGQLGIDAVDLGTATGEYSAWLNTAEAGRGVARLAGVLVALRAFTGERPLERLVAPVAVENPAPGRALASIGFEVEGIARSYRDTAHGRSDHTLWCLHRSDAVVADLRELRVRLAD